MSVLAVGTLLAGCSQVSGLGRSYKDGQGFAQGEIQKGNPLIGDPKTECNSLTSVGAVPDRDDRNQWLAGCEAVMATQTFVGGSTGTP